MSGETNAPGAGETGMGGCANHGGRDLLDCFADAEALRARGVFAAEGRFVVERLIATGRYAIAVLAVTPTARSAMHDALAQLAHDVPVVELAPRELHRLVRYPLDRGCVAVVRRPEVPSVAQLLAARGAAAAPHRRVWLVLEHVTNPDNVGGLFRSAAAFGVAGIVLVGGCADPLYRKAVRTSLGNTLVVPWATAASADDALDAFTAEGVVSVALVSRGAPHVHVWRAPWPGVAVWVGNEGEGLSARALDGCPERVSIAMPGGIDSLNVGVAGAIALHHLATPLEPGARD